MTRNVNSPLRNNPVSYAASRKARRQPGGSRYLYIYLSFDDIKHLPPEKTLNAGPDSRRGTHLLRASSQKIRFSYENPNLRQFNVIMTGRRSNNSAILPFSLSASPLPAVLLPKCPQCTEIRGETIRCDDGVVAYVFCLSGAAHLPVRGNVFTKYFNYLIVKSARSSSCRSKKRVLLIAELDDTGFTAPVSFLLDEDVSPDRKCHALAQRLFTRS